VRSDTPSFVPSAAFGEVSEGKDASRITDQELNSLADPKNKGTAALLSLSLFIVPAVGSDNAGAMACSRIHAGAAKSIRLPDGYMLLGSPC
jgi:hypothetical protein